MCSGQSFSKYVSGNHAHALLSAEPAVNVWADTHRVRGPTMAMVCECVRERVVGLPPLRSPPLTDIDDVIILTYLAAVFLVAKHSIHFPTTDISDGGGVFISGDCFAPLSHDKKPTWKLLKVNPG